MLEWWILIVRLLKQRTEILLVKKEELLMNKEWLGLILMMVGLEMPKCMCAKEQGDRKKEQRGNTWCQNLTLSQPSRYFLLQPASLPSSWSYWQVEVNIKNIENTCFYQKGLFKIPILNKWIKNVGRSFWLLEPFPELMHNLESTRDRKFCCGKSS